MQGFPAPITESGRLWEKRVDQNLFDDARLAVQLERYKVARRLLRTILFGERAIAADRQAVEGRITGAANGAGGADANAATAPAAGAEDMDFPRPPVLGPIPFHIHAPPTIRDASLLLAECLYMAGRYDECLMHCAQAIQVQMLPPNEVHVDLLHGWILKRRGRALSAREIAHRNLKRNAGPKSKCIEASFLHLRGMCEYTLIRHEAAMRDLRDAVALYRLAGQWGGEAEALTALAVVERISGRLPAAIEQYEEAMRLNERLGKMLLKGKNQWQLAVTYVKTGRAALALPMLAKSEENQKRRDCLQTRINIRIARAKAYLQLGRIEDARREVAPDLEAAGRLGFIREEELVLETLGDAALASGQTETARRYYDRAMALGRAIGKESDLVAGVKRRQAEVALAEGDLSGAVDMLREAIRSAGASLERYEEGISQRLLAEALRRLGHWRKAYEACRKSISVLRDFGAERELAHGQLEAARIRLAWWQAKEGNGAPKEDLDGEIRGHLEVAWSYVIEAFHGFADLNREEGCRACTELMEELRSEAHLPWRVQTVASQLALGGGMARESLIAEGRTSTGTSAAAAANGTRSTPFIARSPAMQTVLDMVRVAGASREPVLMTGETGTGKELIARLIHDAESNGRAFVAVNCAAVPETLFEREFFGHGKGAFTGADSDKAGLCEAANGGTLLLDEIGEMPVHLQVKLLRLLQEGTFRRLGEPQERQVDLRIIAATNAPLPELIREKRFRQDLFYRLQILEIHLPPLRERAEDIDPLLELFVARAAGAGIKPEDLFDEDVMAALRRYPWPGNVRELESMSRRLALLALHTGRASLEMLPPEVARWREQPSGVSSSLSLALYLERAEKERIVEALTRTEGNRSEAARALGISRNTLYKKMERLGIRIPA